MNRTPETTISRLPKLCGSDVELGNFVLGGASPRGTGEEASRALLAEIRGYPGRDAGPVQDPQDWGRKFLPSNGGCAYLDLHHLEICTPEVLSASDHVAIQSAILLGNRLGRPNAEALVRTCNVGGRSPAGQSAADRLRDE